MLPDELSFEWETSHGNLLEISSGSTNFLGHPEGHWTDAEPGIQSHALEQGSADHLVGNEEQSVRSGQTGRIPRVGLPGPFAGEVPLW